MLSGRFVCCFAILQFVSRRVFIFQFCDGSLFNLFEASRSSLIRNSWLARVELWLFCFNIAHNQLQHVFFSRLSASIDFRFESNWSRHKSEFECLSILNFLREPFLKFGIGRCYQLAFIPCVPHRLVLSKQQVSFLDSQFRAAALCVFFILPDFPFSLRYVRRRIWGSSRVLLARRSAFFWRKNKWILVSRIRRFSWFFRPIDLQNILKMIQNKIFTFWILTM